MRMNFNSKFESFTYVLSQFAQTPQMFVFDILGQSSSPFIIDNKTFDDKSSHSDNNNITFM